MVAMTNSAAGEHTRIADASLPAPVLGLTTMRERVFVFRIGETVWKTRTHPYIFASRAIKLGDDVRLPTAAIHGFTVEDQFLIHTHRRHWHEEPFTLTD